MRSCCNIATTPLAFTGAPRVRPFTHPRHRKSTSTHVRSMGSANDAHSVANSGDWKKNLITSPEEIHQLVLGARTVAVLGIKTEAQANQPAFFVAEYLQQAGLEVIPVPVFYPEVTHILGKPVYRRVADVPVAIDILDVFRKPSDVPGHLDDILAARPKCVWLQSGIRAPEAEEALARAGIKVVADHCIKVEHRAAAAAAGSSSRL